MMMMMMIIIIIYFIAPELCEFENNDGASSMKRAPLKGCGPRCRCRCRIGGDGNPSDSIQDTSKTRRHPACSSSANINA